MNENTQALLKTFFDNVELSTLVENALLTCIHDPAARDPRLATTHWLFNTAILDSSKMSFEEYGKAVAVKVQAIQLISATFDVLRRAATTPNPVPTTKNPAR